MNNMNDTDISRNFEIDEETDNGSKHSYIKNISKNFNKSVFFARNSFAKKCEKSVVSNFFDKLYYLILFLPLKALGIFLTAFASSALILKYIMEGSNLLFFTKADTVSIVIVFIVGLMFLPVVKNIGDLLCGSKIFSQFSIVYSQSALLNRNSTNLSSFESNSTAMFLGIILGIFSIFYPASNILIMITALIYVIFIFSRPECGVLFTLYTLPLFTSTAVLMLSFITFIALFFKYLRGKRHITFNFLHIMFLVCVIFFILKGYFTNSQNRSFISTFSYIAFILVCLTVINLVRSTSMLNKGINIIVAASRIYIVVFICYYVCGMVFGISKVQLYLDSLLFNGLTTALTNKSFLASILALALPINFSVMVSSKNATGFIKNVVYFSLLSACTMFVDSFVYTLVLMLSCVIVLAFIKKRFLSLIIPCPFLAFGITKLYGILPKADLSPIDSIFNSQSKDLYFKLIAKAPILGIGLGDANLENSLASVSGKTNFQNIDSGSTLLSLCVMIGLLGAIILIVMLSMMLTRNVYFIVHSDNINSNKAKLLSAGLFSASVSFILCCIFLNCIYDFRIAYIFASTISLGYASGQCIEADFIDPTMVREFKQH